MNRVLLALALVAPAFAGCLGASEVAPNATGPESLVSQVLFGEVIGEHMPVESFDGTVIDMWVFRPDVGDSDEQVPVIINFSPYWSNLAPPAATRGDAFSQYLIDYYVPRGYAAALVSARGTGLSEGCFTIGGPDEVKDMGVVVDFLVGQAWSNGNVTATGKSYDGTMAQGLLTLNHPAVKTIAPVSPISEFYKYNYYNGVPYMVTGHVFNTYYVADVSVSQNVPPLGGDPLAFDPTDPTYEKTPTRFCDESVAVQTNQYHTLTTGDYTPYWQARNYTALLPDQVDASVFYIHGLQDWNVKPDHMDPWIAALHERDVPVKMYLGQWAHDYPTRDDWNMTMLRWFDHYLKGIDTGILAEPLVQVQDNEGVWRTEAEWPVARAARTTFHLDASGALQADPGSGSFSYRDEPASGLATGGNAMRFETTFPEGARIVGSPVVHALVSATGPRATLSATLYIDGKAVNDGALDLYHRDSLVTGTPMTPGTQYAVAFSMFPQDLVVPAGGTLTVELGHSAEGLSGMLPNPTGSMVTVTLGEKTWLALPVVALDDITPEMAQPEDVGCWAC